MLVFHVPRYDPYVPRSNNGSGAASGGARGSGGGSSNPKVASLQKELDEATGVMQSNIQSVLGRGDTLDRLQDQTGKYFITLKNRLWSGTSVGRNAVTTIREQRAELVSWRTVYSVTLLSRAQTS